MQRVPMAWESVQSAWNHEALISPLIGRGEASRLLRRKSREVTMTRNNPADASVASWSDSQATKNFYQK
jgi:hypothetical protein